MNAERDKMNNRRTRVPSTDYLYSESVAEAVKWLGDRYLLARPIQSRRPIRIPGSTGPPA